MTDLTSQFEAALAQSKTLSERPDNLTLLKLYALYKQASAGDNTQDKPGMSDFVGGAKWSAWNALQGTAKEVAMQQYIDLMATLD
jgi:diazepam-binding inhibitor (GABA receptor modulator, acyl-CoA-binding protein)